MLLIFRLTPRPVPQRNTTISMCVAAHQFVPLPAAEPFEHWFYIHEWAPLIIFFGTYLGIVRNKKIPHVARYHIMMVRVNVVQSDGMGCRIYVCVRVVRFALERFSALAGVLHFFFQGAVVCCHCHFPKLMY